MNIHNNQLFWCEQKGYRVSTYVYIYIYIWYIMMIMSHEIHHDDIYDDLPIIIYIYDKVFLSHGAYP